MAGVRRNPSSGVMGRIPPTPISTRMTAFQGRLVRAGGGWGGWGGEKREARGSSGGGGEKGEVRGEDRVKSTMTVHVCSPALSALVTTPTERGATPETDAIHLPIPGYGAGHEGVVMYHTGDNRSLPWVMAGHPGHFRRLYEGQSWQGGWLPQGGVSGSPSGSTTGTMKLFSASIRMLNTISVTDA